MAEIPTPAQQSTDSVRLLHAADLHLERVPVGLTEIPQHLRELLLDSAYTSARRVFETAINEQVDALLLAGDVVDLSLAGPRAIVFLREQCERLDEKDIPIYWAGGQVDPPHAWPRATPLPKNVVRFPVDHVQVEEVIRDGQVVAQVSGTSSQGGSQPALSRFAPHPDGVLSVAVTYGTYKKPELSHQQVHFAALGGRHERTTFADDDRLRRMHYSGAAQGASPAELGPHGCTLLTGNASGSLKTKAIATDAFRWHVQQFDAQPDWNMDEVERRLAARADAIKTAHDGTPVLVQWRVVSDALASVSAELRRSTIERLRERFGHQNPLVWTVDLELRRGSSLPKRRVEEDSILGDVLRELRQLQSEPFPANELALYIGEGEQESPLGRRLIECGERQQREVLRAATERCIETLSGESETDPIHPQVASA